ncbi:MAG: hypothetical protein H6667_17110 [Ardenticatenaceae bacterium]|nr:hypothetical protein [Ardenticatenaceae bacterium]MCB9443172.1 hypothetical protein [Ardenticatenaceae bacterium]
MVRKFLFISLAGLLLTVSLGFTNFKKTVLASSDTIDAEAQQQILDATVRITLFAPLTDDADNPQYVTVDGQQAIQYVVGEGLGTLARSGSDVFIITHDHWTLLTPNLTKVQFHNVVGELLLEVSGADFQQMIRYRDGGTMVLNAADELVSGLTAVSPGDSRSVGKNDIVYLAYRQPENGIVSVVAMLVKKEMTYKGKAIFKLTSLNGKFVVEGNSGGGLLFNHQLVGNMWGTILERQVLRETGEVISPLAQTSLSLAAQLPNNILLQ